MTTQINNQIDCCNLSSDEINYKVKELIFNKAKHILLKNVNSQNGLLERIKGEIKIEILGHVGSDFASDVSGLKVIVNGNVGDNSATGAKSTKFTVFGLCGNSFGCNSENNEFYIFENCGLSSFSSSTKNNIVLGGLPASNFATRFKEGVILILNLQGGSVFVEDNWFENLQGGKIYLRSADRNKIKTSSNKFSIQETRDSDEDVYLPRVSEFARLFNYSLSEIKSKPFYGINLK